jgi:hypothetical protein
VSSQELGGLAMGLFAMALGGGGIYAALRTRRRRAEIASTYGSTGGVVYTGVQIGCSGVLVLGGITLIALAILAGR